MSFNTVFKTDLIDPQKADLYKDNALMSKYINLALDSGYKKYGIYGDLAVSIYQFAFDYEKLVEKHGEFDKALYPEWFTSKKLGLVWSKEVHAPVSSTLEYQLVYKNNTNSWFHGKTKEEDYVKFAAQHGEFGLYQHVSLKEDEKDETMLQLLKSKRLGFIFKREEGKAENATIHGNYTASMNWLLNKPTGVKVFVRKNNIPTRKDNLPPNIEKLDNYYEGKKIEDTETLIFYPSSEKAFNSQKEFYKDGTRLYDEYDIWKPEQAVISFYDIWSRTNVDMLEVVKDGKEHCFNDVDNVNRWCTDHTKQKIYEAQLSPDFTNFKNDAKCYAGNTKECLFNYKMAFDFTPYKDYKTCKDETPSTEADKILAVSIANRFKIEQFEAWMNNGKDDAMFNNFIFQLTDGDEKPDDEEFKALDDYTEIEFKNNVLKGSDLLTVSGTTLQKFTKDASSLGSFKLQGGWYKAKCLESINLGSNTADHHKRWTKALNFFFPDQNGFPPTRIYFYGESFLFLLLVLIIPIPRVASEWLSQSDLEKKSSLGPLSSTEYFAIEYPSLTWLLFKIAEALILAVYLTLLIGGIIVFAWMPYDEAKSEWGATDNFYRNLINVGIWILIAAIASGWIVLQSVASWIYLWRKGKEDSLQSAQPPQQTGPAGAAVSYAVLPSTVP